MDTHNQSYQLVPKSAILCARYYIYLLSFNHQNGLGNSYYYLYFINVETMA